MKDNLDFRHLGQNYYAELKRLLAARNWKAADQETLRSMCKVLGRGKNDILSVNDIQAFPKSDIFTIDQLWRKYSNDQFGFSIQKEVWKYFHSPRCHNLDWEKFITAIGWCNSAGKQFQYRELTFNRAAPKGHLPCSVYGLKPFNDLEQFEVGNCEWFMFRAFADRLKSLQIDAPQTVITKSSIGKPPKFDEIISPKPLDVFISYSPEDETLKAKLEEHLSAMVRERKIKPWQDRMIDAGVEWDAKIQAQIEAAQLILLLITPSFMASDYIYNYVLTRVMERHRLGTAQVVPIILRPVDFEGTPFSKLKVLPQDTQAVTIWPDQDSAFENIAKGIRQLVESLISES